MRKRLLACAAAAFILAALAGGCGSGVPQAPDDALIVGGKDMTEQVILSHITRQVLAAAGIPVTDGGNAGNSMYNRNRLLTGEIDLYWGYTDIVWQSILNGEPVQGVCARQFYEKVRDVDLQNDIHWLEKSYINNVLGIAMTGDLSRRLGIRTLSDLAAHLSQNELTFIGSVGFIHERADGLPGLYLTYGIDFGDNVIIVMPDETYDALLEGRADAGMSTTTDWRLLYHDLIVLHDDKGHFNYNMAAPKIRADALERFPQAADILAPVAARLNNSTIRYLNFLLGSEGYSPARIARDWLVAEGFIEDDGELGAGGRGLRP